MHALGPVPDRAPAHDSAPKREMYRFACGVEPPGPHLSNIHTDRRRAAQSANCSEAAGPLLGAGHVPLSRLSPTF